jgi:nicotinate-nucleotide adenylyltransferase
MRTGILGGTFDPIHLGHTFIAREIAAVLSLDKVIFMVSQYPPHKKVGEISSPFHRYAMVALELMDSEKYFASQVELFRNKPSYTVDTLEEFSKSFPDEQHCFIAGTDSLSEIHLWHQYDKLFLRHCMVFVQRPGAEVDLGSLEIATNLKDLIQIVEPGDAPEIQKGRSLVLSLDAPPISSTKIRRMIASGKRPPTDQLSPSVYKYIRKYRLYEPS